MCSASYSPTSTVYVQCGVFSLVIVSMKVPLRLYTCILFISGCGVCVHTLAVCTFLQWAYSEFVGIAPSPKATNEFVITVRKGKKGGTQQMTFSSDYRAEIITETLVSYCIVTAGQSATLSYVCSMLRMENEYSLGKQGRV